MFPRPPIPLRLCLILLCLGAALANAAEAPYSEDFNGYRNGVTPANFVESTNADWAIYDGTYRAITYKTRNEHYASSSIPLSNVAGHNFTVTARFSLSVVGITLGEATTNKMYLGLGAFGTDPNLTAGSAHRVLYYVAGGYDVTGLFGSSPIYLPPTTGPYVMTLHGGYVDGRLYSTATITNANGTRSFKRVESAPPTGQSFGFIQFTYSGFSGGAQLTVNYDDFSVVFESEPVKLANLSTRLRAGTGEQSAITGFVVTGDSPKRILIRGGIGDFGGLDWLPDPVLELRDSRGEMLALNDNWQDTQEAEIKAIGMFPAPKDSGLIVTLKPGAYTALLRDKDNAAGLAMIQLYDLDKGVDSRLGNLSTRGQVGTGDNVMLAGAIASGDAKAHVLVRALGPSMRGAGVNQPLADPTLELRDENGGLVKENDNWRDTQEAEIAATTLAPPNDAEAAIIADLLPTNYTAILRGKNGTTGVALVEFYHLN